MRARPRIGGHEAELTPLSNACSLWSPERASNQEAAECLYISVATIRTHLENADRKSASPIAQRL